MIIEFEKMYADLVCEDVPRTQLHSPEHDEPHEDDVVDPWDGTKPHAADGFVAKYCSEH